MAKLMKNNRMFLSFQDSNHMFGSVAICDGISNLKVAIFDVYTS